MKAYEYITQSVVPCAGTDCSINISLLQGVDDFKVMVMHIAGTAIGNVEESNFTSLDEAMGFYEDQVDLHNGHPYAPTVRWENGAPVT